MSFEEMVAWARLNVMDAFMRLAVKAAPRNHWAGILFLQSIQLYHTELVRRNEEYRTQAQARKQLQDLYQRKLRGEE